VAAATNMVGILITASASRRSSPSLTTAFQAACMSADNSTSATT